MAGVAFFDIDSFQLEEGVVATEYERPAPAPDYPIEIHSLNDFDVVSSVGKENLLDGLGNNKYLDSSFYATDQNSVEKVTIDDKVWLKKISGSLRFKPIRIEKGETYTYSMDILSENDTSLTFQHWFTGGYGAKTHQIKKGFQRLRHTFVSEGIADILHTGFPNGLMFSNVKIEAGATGTPYIPHSSEESYSNFFNKINLLLDEPLRSVGDVHDRLFRDTDGLWKVERNVGEYTYDGTTGWSVGHSTGGWKTDGETIPFYNYDISNYKQRNQNVTTTHLPVVDYNTATIVASDSEGYSIGYAGFKILRIKKTRVSSLDNAGIRQWLSQNPVTVQYELNNSVIELLSQELQDKLNNIASYANSNYAYTVLPDKSDLLSEKLKPTLHAIFKGGGWYNRWKTEDELRKHQTSIDDKADNSATESALNEAAAKLQVLQQEIEAAATSNELKDFINKYNKDMASRDKDARESESSLSSALASISSIQTNMGDMSATWKFIDRFIKNTPQGIVVGNDSSGSYILIKEDRLAFYSNGQEVAFISQNLMEISRGAFVEQIQIAKYQFEESTTNHLTIRYVG